ncbi:type II toxin-antitoxin system VapC family toxin [Arsenicitalea aurantiaca]|uniref:Ribonuclease VapC n=1 Tax=Arsenicitalea aurantiaca TaxID=1783274 RepID=A0A433XA99_9HYPH|nr:type II toxin-antitoxin system VapC family toxin [Arsenicitalea aurantiaca]RUT31006.1 type II toxin-antitoxin system VapC family toxin [Arsenicitalea aurantiaca]
MSYLLDTNVISEIRRPERANPQVRSWFASIDIADCAISVVTLLELETGVARAFHRGLPHAEILRRWLDAQVVPAFADRILSVDTTIARRCAALHLPQTRPYADALIAATALVSGRTLVTRNLTDFAGTGVPLLDPWAG